MKAIFLKSCGVLICFFFEAILTSAFAQTKHEVIAMKDLPPAVNETYKTMYPDAILTDLYATPTYQWNFDYYPEWYNEWYDPYYWGPNNMAPQYEFSSPENYEIDFTRSGVKSRSLYGSNGKWIETRSDIKQLPAVINESIKNSEYKDWKIAKHIEEINSPYFKGTHFRVAFKNGIKTHVVTFNDNGKIISKKMMEKKV